MKTFMVLLFLTLPLLGLGQINAYNSLRVGATVIAKKQSVEYGLREELRFFSDSSRKNTAILAPSLGFLFNDRSKLRVSYWFILNEVVGSRLNVDYINDFDWIESRLRLQVGWDEFGDNAQYIRHLLVFKAKDVEGFFNPSADFEVFHEIGSLYMLDRYRGGVANKFRVSESMIITVGLQNQQFADKRLGRDYLYRVRITYKVI